MAHKPMLMREEWLDSLPDNLTKHLQALNLFTVQRICRRIAEIGSVKTSDAHALKSSIEYAAADLAEIEKEVSRATKLSVNEVERIFEEAAKENVDFANVFYKARGLDELTAENRNIRVLVEAIKRRTEDEMKNLSKTYMIGFKRGRRIIPLREYYIGAIDRAILFAQSGTVDYHTAIRSTVKEMSRSGLRRVTFETGYNRRLDSQARMNVLEGVRQLNAKMMEQTGEEFGADGYEISAHALCAPDHLHIQGRRFTKKAYEQLNRQLKRPIGTLNCSHFATPVIMGVGKPVYSAQELADLRRRSQEKVEYDGKAYTMYEASQRQRQYETAIRYAKEERDALKAAGDTTGAQIANKRVRSLSAEYRGFSDAVGLRPRPERARVAKP